MYYPRTVTFASWEVRVYRGFGARVGRVIRSPRGLVSPKAPGFDEIPAGAATASQKVGFVTIQLPLLHAQKMQGKANHYEPGQGELYEGSWGYDESPNRL